MKRHRLMRVCAIAALTLSAAAIARPLDVNGASTFSFASGVLTITGVQFSSGVGSVTVTTSTSGSPLTMIDIDRKIGVAPTTEERRRAHDPREREQR